jgi:hypothetical protein
MADKGTRLWEVHDEAAELMARDGLDERERHFLARFEALLWALETGLALIKHGDVPRQLYREPHPWLVVLLAHMGPGRILRYLDLPLPCAKASKTV